MGSFLFGRLHRLFPSPNRRAVLAASFAAQAIVTAAVAGMVKATTGPAARAQGKEDLGWQVLVPIALVAFQSCGQAVVSRVLRYDALTSVVLTSVYCDLFADVELFALRNAERDRRTAAALFLLLGAFVGGRFAHSDWGVAGALWAAAMLKAVVVVLWLAWPAAKESEES